MTKDEYNQKREYLVLQICANFKKEKVNLDLEDFDEIVGQVERLIEKHLPPVT